jgi:adenylate kinase family enzyme
VVLVTGLQAAGKSTVAARLAARFERAAFIEGDVLWKMIVAGREDMTAEPSQEARR